MSEQTALAFDDPQTVERFAIFSPCRRYRYALTRSWDFAKPLVMFVGLNPSTADENVDDPTIRRCIGFARDWSYGGLVMTNLFGYRATDPRDLLRASEPVGDRTDHWLRHFASLSGLVVAAWGTHGGHRDRAAAVLASGALGDYRVLGLTKDGHPRHPLYMRADTTPFVPAA